MDIVSCDFLYSLCVSAALNYKRDSLLRPFPPFFVNEDQEKAFDDLIKTATKLPALHKIQWNNTDHINPKSIRLLKWVINPKTFHLTLADNKEFQKFTELTADIDPPHAPDYLFKVVYNDKKSEKFQQLAEEHSLMYAYHGSRVENFHSILHNGLRNNLNKVTLFGEGIYLSSSFKVSAPFSPTGTAWSNSFFGDSISCVALCELVNHPDVKCSVEAVKEDSKDSNLRNRSSDPCSSQKSSKHRSYIKGSEGGQIPDKYFVVRNDELVRVKYIALFAPKADKKLISNVLSGKTVTPTERRGFFARHQFFLLMISYIFILFLIGFFNSSVFTAWWRNRAHHEESPFLP
uniref:mono [ADP-ribose] polymerase PARP16 n=1 Tax=Ciona intestinalis TaxID=7719 RepID=UPI0000520DAD|nr:mono [ADP-ribose] polymerase PARP16 [Ciona intestinalis]|eukprot:XP_002128236.1 mono [ADP-ribose] polymerase PARP16 [Ciona intestinalis]